MEKDGAEVLLAIDDKGLYFTSQDRVDRNMADTNRYAVSRNVVRDYLEKMGLSPVELFEQNKHRIRKSDGEPKKKINVHLLTGRSHQIRVQFSSRDHSIVGDVKYGSAEKLRGHIVLWAYKLSFFHPTKKEKMEFTYFPGGHPFNLFHI